MKSAILFLGVLLFTACRKDHEYCWQVYDALGNEAGIVCGKTETAMTEQYGVYFDRQDAKKYCWKIQYSAGGPFSYPENITEKMAGIFFQGAVTKEKFTCGYCQKWMWREKGLYKPSGSFAYKPIKVEMFCGDTCATLFAGRIIIVRDTPDSLITVEFMQKL
ncbi:MAG TPA: hypothetical protein VGO58_12050 [Chitinophagaceae bacterium]|jgi:hypothetical protein|nr:hypothetical protein [Chitinophagaceae bacterium]